MVDLAGETPLNLSKQSARYRPRSCIDIGFLVDEEIVKDCQSNKHEQGENDDSADRQVRTSWPRFMSLCLLLSSCSIIALNSVREHRTLSGLIRHTLRERGWYRFYVMLFLPAV